MEDRSDFSDDRTRHEKIRDHIRHRDFDKAAALLGDLDDIKGEDLDDEDQELLTAYLPGNLILEWDGSSRWLVVDIELAAAEARGAISPLCETCRVWGRGSCKVHQTRRAVAS